MGKPKQSWNLKRLKSGNGLKGEKSMKESRGTEMRLKYEDEDKEDAYYQEFLDDTKENWSMIEQPRIRDFIRWAIIKGYLK